MADSEDTGVARRGAAGDTLLIQFAKAPEPGKVKTRLLPALSPEAAAAVHIELMRHTAEYLVGAALGPVHLAVAGATGHPVFQSLLAGGVSRIISQRGADLGLRMFHAIEDALSTYTRVLLVGSDCPFIDADYLNKAVDALDSAPVVLGAAQDGGFVLLGATRMDLRMFAGVAWGTGTVLAHTQENLRGLGIGCTTLAALQDIDRPEDLAAWEAHKAGQLTG